MRQETYDVTIRGNEAIVSRSGSRRAISVARILGSETDEGVTTYWLDRLVVPPGNRELNEAWSASGCVSTILVQCASAT